jgi:hypothetical protein
MKRNKDIKVQTEVFAEIYTAMEFATEERLDYLWGEKITSIEGTFHLNTHFPDAPPVRSLTH